MTDAASERAAAGDADSEVPAAAEVGERPGLDGISDKIKREFELVPAIGTRWSRWYDAPYRVLHWLLTDWRRKLVPWRVRLRLNGGINYLLAFDHYERLKVKDREDPLDNLIVPDDEHVTQGGIWVVEFFPPSYSTRLLRALKKTGWDAHDHMVGIDGTHAEQVAKARRGRGFAWKRLATVARPDSPYLVFDAKRELLPEEFDLIELTAVQLGSSLTAVVAFVRFSEKGASGLNSVWKAEREPTLEWRGFRRPQVEGRYHAAILATQDERQRLHDLARDWLAARCGGFFADTEARQPVVDFNLFKLFDPLAATDSRDHGEPLRALGMEGNHLYNYVSPHLPGAVFVQGETLTRARELLRNCWGVVGSYDTFARLNERDGYGSKPYSVNTLAAMADDVIRSFLLYVAVVHYGHQLREAIADARDTARTKHRDFRPRQVEQLKHELLTTSLDLPAVARDSGLLWKPFWRRWDGLDVKAVPAPDVPTPPEEFDLIERLRKVHKGTFKKLLEEDAAYRTVLSTASSLGASAASARLGRRALFVSGTSLFVSITALSVANGDAIWRQLTSWF